jgi:predicted deacylase
VKTLRIEEFAFADLPRGAHQRFWLHALDLLAGPVLLPTIVVSGVNPGPTLFVVAGVHGDEYEGMAALRRVAAQLEPSQMQGRLVAIPVVNPFAYEARARIAPLHIDGLNLARIFPGDRNGSPSQILAHQLLNLVLRNLGPDDLFFDFHSGSADVAFAPLIGYRDIPGEATKRAAEAARYFGIEQIWRIPDSPGPFNAETTRRGIPTLGTEITGRAGCDPEDVAVYERGLRNLIAYLGIVPEWPSPVRVDRPERTTVEIVAPATGFFDTEHRLYDDVSEGDVLGKVLDLFGETVAEVRSPTSGPIWAARSMPAVRTGELLSYIAIG